MLLLNHFSRVRLFATPWNAAHQAPPSMGFSRQEYWSGWPLPSPKSHLNDPYNHNGVVTHLELDILECEVKWVLGSVTTNKASEGDGIPAELFKILKDGAVKVLHSICQQIWKTQQCPQDWKMSVFIPIPKKGNTKGSSNYISTLYSCTHFTC